MYFCYNSQSLPLRNMLSMAVLPPLTLSLRKRPIWRLRRTIVKLWLQLDNKLSNLKQRKRPLMRSSRWLLQSQSMVCCHSANPFQDTVAWTGESKLITCSVWPMLRPVRWPLRVLAKSTTRRVTLSRRRVSGITSSARDSLAVEILNMQGKIMKHILKKHAKLFHW